jgi:hypothetical protein
LWVEKDALSGVLAPLAREFHVPEESDKKLLRAAVEHLRKKKPEKGT